MNRVRRPHKITMKCTFTVEVAMMGVASREINQYPTRSQPWLLFESSPSSDNREARRLAGTVLEATVWELEDMRSPLLRKAVRSSRVALGQGILTSLCVPIASELMSSTHWCGWTQGTWAWARSKTSFNSMSAQLF